MKHEVLTSKFVLPLWNDRDLEVIDDFVDLNADIQTTFLAGKGPKALKLNVIETFNAFSGLELTIEQVVQRGSQVIYQWSATALHTGLLLNTPPTDKKISFSGVVLGKLQEDKIVQYHSLTNIPQVLAATQKIIYPRDPSNANIFDKEHLVSIIKNATGKRLTVREIECLSFWLKGFSIKNTAKILGGLSCRTVQTFRENIKKKLNAETFQEVFYIIQETGVIPILLENATASEAYLDIFEIQPTLLDVSDHR